MNHQTMNVQSMEQGAEPGWSRSEFLTGSGPTCNRTAGRYWGRTSGAGNPSGSWSIWRASLCAAPVGTAAADQPGWATVNSSPARSWWLCPRLYVRVWRCSVSGCGVACQQPWGLAVATTLQQQQQQRWFLLCPCSFFLSCGWGYTLTVFHNSDNTQDSLWISGRERASWWSPTHQKASTTSCRWSSRSHFIQWRLAVPKRTAEALQCGLEKVFANFDGYMLNTKKQT